MLVKNIKELLRNRNFVLGDNFLTLTNKETVTLINNISIILKNKSSSKKIAVYLPRNFYYIASIFAIWLSNKCFIPLSQQWPKSYVLDIIKEGKIDLIITNKNFSFFGKFKQLIISEKYYKKKIKKTKKKITDNYKKNKIAYIMYTSGSTGKPKGIIINYYSLMSYISWLTKKFFKENKNNLSLLITGEITFDIIIADLSFAISRKTSIFITNDNKNVFSALSLIKEKPIDIIYTVPTFMSKLIEANNIFNIELKKISYVFCGGEVFKKKLFKEVKKNFLKSRVFNMYGPTECTMNCLSIELTNFHKLKDMKVIPTGKPFKHLKYRLIKDNKTNKKEGELLVGGKQLMEGYLNHKEDVFKSIKGIKYYPTGDYFKKINNIYYFQGRINEIKKISGFRLNLNYIEEMIEKINGVQSCKIIIKKDDIICFASSSHKSINLKSKIYNYCKKKLPNYMMPNKIISINKFEHNERGKLNIKKLNKML